jgi:Flp pilus assembly secretin CpaC
MGTKIPLPAFKPPTVDGKPMAEAMPGLPAGGGPVTYQEIGTNIDCAATIMEDGRYELSIVVEDNSIPREDAVRAAKTHEPPMIRTFRMHNRVILRDGQSTQFTAATDRISGETVRIDVTLNVAK